MDLKEEEILGDHASSHWYYASKAAAMRAYLRKKSYQHVLDVGAGSGFFSKHLLERGIAGRATLVDTGYDREHTETHHGRQVDYRTDYANADFDLALFMDVLEHVPDPVALLKHYLDIAKPGTEVFVSVPAFKFLWSGHDDFLGHYRRYTTRGLRENLTGAGLRIDNCTYYFGFVFPIAAARRLLSRSNGTTGSDLKVHHPMTNAVLSAICTAELPFVRLNGVAGLSVFGSASKT